MSHLSANYIDYKFSKIHDKETTKAYQKDVKSRVLIGGAIVNNDQNPLYNTSLMKPSQCKQHHQAIYIRTRLATLLVDTRQRVPLDTNRFLRQVSFTSVITESTNPSSVTLDIVINNLLEITSQQGLYKRNVTMNYNCFINAQLL